MLSNYLKVALKVLMRRKFYTAVNLMGIAFTLLVLILAAALLDNSVSSAAPETHLGRILAVTRVKMEGPKSVSTGSAGYRLLDQFARGLPRVEKFSIMGVPAPVASFVDGEKIVSELKRTDGIFWEIMEFEFLEGGPYTQADEEAGSFVAVISESARRKFFKNDGPAVGLTLRADGQAFTVVGVVRDVPVTRLLSFAEIWAPISTTKSTTYKADLRGGFEGILLAESRADFPVIKAELKRRLDAAELPDPDRYDTLVAPALSRFESLAADFTNEEFEDDPPTVRFIAILSLMAAGFMLIPALNLVNLSLSRILERASEIGVRKAFGASSTTLVGQFLIENVVLTLVGGAVGFVASFAVLGAINESGLIPHADLQVSPRVFLAGLGLSLVFAMLAGALPAWRMSRLHPVEALHGRVR